MTKPANRSYSRYAQNAAELLGLMIRSARIERAITIAEIAERAGISRGLVHRIEIGISVPTPSAQPLRDARQ